MVGASGDAAVDKEICQYPFIRRIDKIPKEELILEYRRADLFVLPSLAESFGLVYAEALSQGVPVIYSQGQGFDKQFSEGYVGYRVNASDAVCIAERIEMALANYASLQKNCCDAAQKFAQKLICEQSIKLYTQDLQ